MAQGKASIGDLVAHVAASADEGSVRLPQCQACQRTMWPPEVFCDACGSERIALSEPLADEGTLWSFVEYHHPFGSRAADVPYLLGYVEIDGAAAMVGPIVEAGWDDLYAGARVRVQFLRQRQGFAVIGFAPQDKEQAQPAGTTEGP